MPPETDPRQSFKEVRIFGVPVYRRIETNPAINGRLRLVEETAAKFAADAAETKEIVSKLAEAVAALTTAIERFAPRR